MADIAPWLYVTLIAVASALALFFVFRRRQPSEREDLYTRGLELWLAGDLAGASEALRGAVNEEPTAVDPYLQLGNLLRQTGDPQRAAVLHRGLTVRTDVPASKRGAIGMALAEDLLALSRWDEAEEVLRSLEPIASDAPRFWRARFLRAVGAQDLTAAARALQAGAKRCGPQDAQKFRTEHASFQADRALQLCRGDSIAEAHRLLRALPEDGTCPDKILYLKALLAARQQDPEKAVTMATSGLLQQPAQMSLFLPILREALLQSGHYQRTLPILEDACQAEKSPPALWIALALLYEKLGRRQEALQLLESKSPDPHLSPNTAAPFLKVLAAAEPDTDFSRLWQALEPPVARASWRCRICGAAQPGIRWFCPSCHGFDSYTDQAAKEIGP